MKTALVLGAGGFIGSHMVKRLREDGYWVRGVDLHEPEFSETEANEFIIRDLRDPDAMRRVIRYGGQTGNFYSQIVDKFLEPFDEIYQFAADMGGAGFIFTMYLADHLGGGPAVRQLVQDSATGGVSVQNLALSPPSGQPGMLGRTMSEIFANFSVAAFLDSEQGIYGFSNLDLTPTCSSGSFCRAQPTETNSDWSTPYSSTGHTVEGWGLRAFKFTPGASSPAPLTIRLTADVSQFDGVIVTKSMIDGLLSVSDLDFQSNVATALVPGFGNLTKASAVKEA